MNIIQAIIWLALFVFIGRWVFAILMLRRGAKWVNTRQLDKADNLYSWMLKYYPKNVLIFISQGIIDSHRGNYNASLSKYDKAISLSKRNKVFGVMAYFYRAYLYLYLERFTDALNDYRQVYEIQLHHNQPIYKAYWGIIASYFYQSDYTSALKEAQQILPEFEKDLSDREKHGAYLIASNAKTDLQIKTLYLFINSLYSLSYNYLGHIDEAKQVFSKLEEKFSGFIVFYTSRAELFFVLGDYSSALSDYEKAMTAFDDSHKRLYASISGCNFNHIVLANYAVILFACGKIDEAQEKWRELQAQAPLLTSAERMGQEFFWTDEMIAKAKELEATLA